MSELASQLSIKLPQSSAVKWIKDNLFNSYLNSLLTLLIFFFGGKAIFSLLEWGIIQSTWTGNAETCRANQGACWAFIGEKYRYILFGHYPAELLWRPVSFVLGVMSLFAASFSTRLWNKKLAYGWIFWIVFSILLLDGRLLGLTFVETSKWGGLPLTLLISFIGIGLSYPLGILLAIFRQSEMKGLKLISVIFIEVMRGVPLISVLFMASVMFPIFMPEGVAIDKLFRAQIAIILFSAAYMAEVVRGGLQSVPRGQIEAANAMGMTKTQSLRLVILPQALRVVIPPTVSTFIGMFKDTSLLIIIALFDLMFTTKTSLSDSNWLGFAREAYIFTALIYFVCCFSMSRLSLKIEEHSPTNKTKKEGANYGF